MLGKPKELTAKGWPRPTVFHISDRTLELTHLPDQEPASSSQENNTKELDFHACAIIRDATDTGIHVLLFDHRIEWRKGGGAERDITNLPPCRYMPGDLGPLAQMFMSTELEELEPVLSMWYGDGGDVWRPGQYIEQDINAQQEQTARGEEPTLRHDNNDSGFENAITWMYKIALEGGDPMSGRDDPRLRGMRQVNLASIMEGVRLFADSWPLGEGEVITEYIPPVLAEMDRVGQDAWSHMVRQFRDELVGNQ